MVKYKYQSQNNRIAKIRIFLNSENRIEDENGYIAILVSNNGDWASLGENYLFNPSIISLLQSYSNKMIEKLPVDRYRQDILELSISLFSSDEYVQQISESLEIFWIPKNSKFVVFKDGNIEKIILIDHIYIS